MDWLKKNWLYLTGIFLVGVNYGLNEVRAYNEGYDAGKLEAKLERELKEFEAGSKNDTLFNKF